MCVFELMHVCGDIMPFWVDRHLPNQKFAEKKMSKEMNKEERNDKKKQKKNLSECYVYCPLLRLPPPPPLFPVEQIFA